MRELHVPRLRWWLKSAGALMVLLLITAVIAVGVIVSIARDPDGRTWLLHGGLALLNRQLPELRIDIDGARAPGLGEWYLERFALYQRGQLSVEARDIALQFDWAALRDRRVQIQRLHAARVVVHQQETTSSASPFTPPRIDLRPWQIVADSVVLEELQWVESSGQPLLPTLQVDAQLALWRDDIPLQGRLSGRSVSAGAFSSWPGAEFAISSQVVEDNRLQLALTASEPAGGWFADRLGVPESQPLMLSTDVFLRDRGEALQVTLDRLAFPWRGHRCVANAEIMVQYDGSALAVERGEIAVDQRHQRVEGRWRRDALDIEILLDRLPLTLFDPWLPSLRDGWATGKINLAGTPSAPAIAADGGFAVTVEDQSGQWRGSGQVQGRYRARQLALANAAVEINWARDGQQASASATVKGDLDFNTPRLAVSGSASRVDSALVTRLLQRFAVPMPERLQPLGAQATVKQFAINGPLTDQWRNVQMQINGAVQGRYRDRPLHLAVDGEGSWQHFTLRRAALDYAGAGVHAEGVVDLYGAENRFAVTVDRLPLTLLRELQQAFSAPVAPVDLTGTLNGKGQIAGALRQPRATFSVAGELQHGALPHPARLILQGHSEPHRVFIDNLRLALRQEAQTVAQLQLQGELDTHSALPAMRWQLDTQNLPLALFAPDHWSGAGGEVSGQLNIRLPAAEQLSADWFAGVQAAGRFDFRSGDLALNSGQSGEAPARVYWSGDIGGGETGGDITLQSQVRLQPSTQEADPGRPGQLNIQLDKAALGRFLLDRQVLPAIALQAQLDLRALAFMLPVGTDLGGQLEADLSLEGGARPRLNGQLQLAESYLSSEDLGITLRPITMTARARGESLRIDTFHAEDGQGGFLEGGGEINWLDFTAPEAIAVELRAQDLKLIDRQEVQGGISGSLQLTGSLQRMLLAGKLQVEPLNVSISGDLPGADIPSIEVSYQRADSEGQQSRWLPTVELDINLQASKRAFLRGRGLDAELAGNLHVAGSAERAQLEGQFNVVRGHFELLGHRFNLVKGDATISDEALSILATGKVKKAGTEITAVLTATNSRVAFTLSSDPVMPEDEILAWLMFGKNIDSISAAQAIQVASAVNTLRGGSSFDPIGATRDILGVDTLTLDTEKTDTGTGVNIGAGKYLTDRVYLELERTPDPAEPWRSSVTIELTPHLNLRSNLSTGSSGEGVELEWYRDY